MAKSKDLRKWYVKTYPDDDLGKDLRTGITLKTIWELMNQNYDFYEIVGGDADSVIRERVFEEIAKENSIEYSDVYDIWMRPVRMKADAREAAAAQKMAHFKSITQAEALAVLAKALPDGLHNKRDIWGIAALIELAGILKTSDENAGFNHYVQLRDGSSLIIEDEKQEQGAAHFLVSG